MKLLGNIKNIVTSIVSYHYVVMGMYKTNLDVNMIFQKIKFIPNENLSLDTYINIFTYLYIILFTYLYIDS